MKFKAGDKVKFLNEKGGGIVARISNDNIVFVKIDDGFEIPVKASELVLIDNNTAGKRMFDDGQIIQNADFSKPEQSNELNITKNPYDFQQGIHLAFIPENQKQLIIGDVQLKLVNNTPFELIYTLFVKDKNKYQGIDFGNVENFGTSNIITFERSELELFGKGCIQMLFYQNHTDNPLKPLQKDFSFKMMKLLHEENFIKNSVYKEKACFFKIIDLKEILPEQSEEISKAIKIPPDRLTRDSLIVKHKVSDGFAEVDLHIDVLCDEPQKLRNHEKLQIQLDYFTRCLEDGIVENYEKIIFIHGVGAGILKVEIAKILESYDYIEYFDASIAKYGIGATEILIHHQQKLKV